MEIRIAIRHFQNVAIPSNNRMPSCREKKWVECKSFLLWNFLAWVFKVRYTHDVEKKMFSKCHGHTHWCNVLLHHYCSLFDGISCYLATSLSQTLIEFEKKNKWYLIIWNIKAVLFLRYLLILYLENQNI